MATWRAVFWLVVPILAFTPFACPGADPRATNQPLDTQPNAPPLTPPETARAAFNAPPGFRVDLFAAEPLVRQPIAFTTDTRGRLWVAENYTYAERPLFLDQRHRDRIIILDDNDGDGRADTQKVFWDQAVQLTSVEMGSGGVWVLCPPQLLFLPDRDGNDRFDGEAEIALDGFTLGIANRHNFANGLKWGPDGWLYGRNGISNVGYVGPPATPSSQRVEIGPGIWRYHPRLKKVEMVCTGTTNPWGHDWDDHGELFFINTVIGHLWHGVPGAHFKRMFGADSNPNVYQLLDQTADHVHWDTNEAWHDAKKRLSKTTDQAGGGHAHSGLMCYLGDNWPPEYRNRLLTLNFHGRRVNQERLQRRGSSYVGKHEADILHTSDIYFRGIDLLYGADGGVYIADWSDVGECHENDGVHRNSGRIFKVTHTGKSESKSKRPQAVDIGHLTNQELVELQIHENEWFVRQARRVLRERADAGQSMTEVHAALRRQFAAHTAPHRQLRALWALYVTGGTNVDWLKEILQSESEYLRAWAIRLLVDNLEPSRQTDVAARLRQQVIAERSSLVQLYLASSLQRFTGDNRLQLADALVARAELAEDKVIPLLLWYGLEPAVAENPSRAVIWAVQARLPLVRRFTARRITQDLARKPEAVEKLVAALSEVSDMHTQRDVLQGMNDALRGWRRATAPMAWTIVREKLRASQDNTLQQCLRELSVVFGDGRALGELRALAASPQADMGIRKAAVRTLAEARADGLLPLFVKLLTEHDLAPEVVRAMAVLDDPHMHRELLAHYPKLYLPAREEAITTLSARPATAKALLEAVNVGTVERGQIPVYQIRQIQGFTDTRIQELLKKLWPELRPIQAEKKTRIEDLKRRLVNIKDADLPAGRVLWEHNCVKCHMLYGKGGNIGPDLTGAQRSNLDYLLENIVDPSATLAANYRMTTMALTDGRVVQGLVLRKTDAVWEVQTPTDKITLPTSDIEQTRDAELSLMPEGLLDLLKPHELRDLFGYLMSARQVPLPANYMPTTSVSPALEPGKK